MQGPDNLMEGDMAKVVRRPRSSVTSSAAADMRKWIVGLAYVIVLSVIGLIGTAVFGLDKGVLNSMAKSDSARGLITYLFAVVTIGTAVVLVVSAIVGVGTDEAIDDKRFQRGKEILALMLGIFGTIIGFYFASGTSGSGTEAAILRLSTLDVTPRVVEAGGKVTVRALVSGGLLPYRFGAGLGDDTVDPTEPVAEGGWIVKDVTARQFRPQEAQVIRVIVMDASGRRIEQTASFTVGPPR